MSTTVNLPSTFISSAAPAANFSAATVIYVGTVPGLGDCTGLLSIPTLPTGNPWTSVVLKLGVFTQSGGSSSTVNVQKVTAPSPLDVTTVTFNTPGLTIDPTIEVSKSIAAADVGTVIEIDITSLINSWYTTSFAGLALTCTDGTFVLFDSMNATDAAKRPALVLTNGGPIPSVDVTIAGRLVDDPASVTVPALPGADQFSTAMDISEKTLVTFFCTNQGAVNANVGVEESIDGTIYTAETQTTIPPGITAVLVPTYYAKFARLYFHSVDPILPTALLISYIAQT